MRSFSGIKTPGRIAIGLVLFCFFFGTAKAQNENFGISVGPYAGVNFSYSGLDAQEHKSFKISPEGSIRVRIDLTKHFGISTGVTYTQKAKYYQYQLTNSFFTDLSNSFLGGFLGEDLDSLIYDALGTTAGFINDTIYSNYTGRVNIHYLQVPLMATLDVKNFSFSAGGYMAFRLGGSATETLKQEFPMYTTFEPALTSDPTIEMFMGFFTGAYPAIKEPVTSEVTNIDFVNSMDYGLSAEVSGRFDKRCSIYIAATLGLKDYSNDPIKYPGRHFTVSAGMGIGFGKIKGTRVPVKLL